MVTEHTPEQLRQMLKRGRKPVPLEAMGLIRESALGKALGLSARTMRWIRTKEPHRLPNPIKISGCFFYEPGMVARMYGIRVDALLEGVRLGKMAEGLH